MIPCGGSRAYAAMLQHTKDEEMANAPREPELRKIILVIRNIAGSVVSN